VLIVRAKALIYHGSYNPSLKAGVIKHNNSWTLVLTFFADKKGWMTIGAKALIYYGSYNPSLKAGVIKHNNSWTLVLTFFC